VTPLTAISSQGGILMNTKKLTWTLAALALILTGNLFAPAAHAVSLSQVGGAVDITNGFSYPLEEASGLGLAKQQTELWSISDASCIVFKMQLNGTAVSNYPSDKAYCPSSVSDVDFEGVTYAPPPPGISDDHYLYIANEKGAKIVPFNYSTHQYGTQVPLSGMAGYSTVSCTGGGTVDSAFNHTGADPNSGIEGITWDPDLATFFVIKEKDPGLLIQISSDLTTILACQKLYFSSDYSDISYDPTRGKFWITGDEDETVYLYDWITRSGYGWNLGKANMEGIAFNPATSRLYIATDNGGGSDSYLYTYNVQ
jgi:WD40 repeat protein